MRGAKGIARTAAAALATAAALALPPVPAAASAAEETVWLCLPGSQPNPCRGSLETTVQSADGASQVENPAQARRPRVDCFYVYPTVSEQPAVNSDRSIDPEQIAIARYQAARFSRVCRVFAPVYRQRTLAAISAPVEQQNEALRIAFADVRAAWRDYLRNHNRGRGFVLIGHSQGTTMLRQLVRTEIDPRPRLRRRLVSALLLGGNVTVRKGEAAGGDFAHVRACLGRRQTGCVIAYSTFNEAPPANSRFGRPPAPGAVNPFGFPSGPAYEVLCTNPASLRANARRGLRTLVRSEPYPGVIGALLVYMYGGLPPSAPTPWVQPSDRYTGRCVSEDGANVLMTYPVGDAKRLNPSPDPSWGLHLADVNIALGNLVAVTARQIRAYLSGAGTRPPPRVPAAP